MRKQCQSCRGEYSDTTADGALYFHACPPLSDAEIGAALKLPRDATKWSDEEKLAIAGADRRRQDARDENIDLSKVAALAEKHIARDEHTDERLIIKAPGLGVRAL